MIRQYSNGRTLNTVSVSGSQVDLETLASVLEGQCEVYISVAIGGEVVNGVTLNPISFSVGKKLLGGSYLAVSGSLKHLRPTKTFKDISAAVKGVWDADYTSGQKSTYCNGYRATSQG